MSSSGDGLLGPAHDPELLVKGEGSEKVKSVDVSSPST